MPSPDPLNTQDIAGILTAVAISIISGVVSITRRIASGYSGSLLWVISEFLTAILCGYLMYNAYPFLDPVLPDFITLPVAVAFVAHSGGRIFQEVESSIIKQYKFFKNGN